MKLAHRLLLVLALLLYITLYHTYILQAKPVETKKEWQSAKEPTGTVTILASPANLVLVKLP